MPELYVKIDGKFIKVLKRATAHALYCKRVKPVTMQYVDYIIRREIKKYKIDRSIYLDYKNFVDYVVDKQQQK